MENKQCYMCDAHATSVEHVPPKCLFPTIKDSGKNHRVDLITVPSCDKHNGEKSRDDEFLMVCIAGIIGNNSIGYQHYHGKIQRALKRTSYKLLDKVFLKKRFYHFHDDNEFLEILWGTPDYQRLIKCFEHIAMGIYRHHYGTNFKGKVKPYLGFLHSNEPNPKAFKELIQHKTAKELENQPKLGSNQEVFYYQYTTPDQFGIFLVKLSFYENVDVYVSYLPEGVEKPSHLGFELVNRGIKTIINEDGKSFEFN
ncbi:hypothetical protein [Thiomicrospira sp. S5]|uniref:hypothetical protein n=1 Tax=Thiomicrospira sp. S5 TaxID=1803865 RepID=UPI000F8A00EE|nr:hypothetical protein [Thiomicrospira sp. S5]AZR80827.1 hypothetical protein AYJ59_00095 [Thiomicrospira sp. S5]